MKANSQLTALVRNVVEPMGYELVGCELASQGKGSQVFRVYIDHENGITLDDCSSVSHQVSGVLDVEDPISGNYNLEISSPGLDRPLFEPEHFERFSGSDVSIKTLMPIDGRRNFKGTLLGREQDNIRLLIDANEIVVAINQIEKARLVPQI